MCSKAVIIPKKYETCQLLYKINRSCPHVTGKSCIALQQKSVPTLIYLPSKRWIVNANLLWLTKGNDLLIEDTPKSYVNTDTLEKYIDESYIPFIEQRCEQMHMPHSPVTMLCENHGTHVADEIKAKPVAINIRLLIVHPQSTRITLLLDQIMFSAIKRDFLTRKSAYMSRIKKEKVKLMYLVLLKHSTSSTNESAFRKAGYSAIFVKKVQKVKIDE
ncbi:MAG: hypothetical protein EZS28_022564 [Streblomastix strix]|uniref:DDE-1 domain-containing protein n=1 Tax=Streblomastix strix TaxID=222440 RepID=A0A5J4VHV5_9EUKA|nr:MAG: hypothetical protein EZS28_022564 [Streblomastix strix]